MAKKGSLNLAFGHVPLRSMMGRTSGGFEKTTGPFFADQGFAAYVAGHEHLVWDQILEMEGGARIRQINCGTGSGTYTYPILPALYQNHCAGSRCEWPENGHAFEIDPKTRKQVDKVTFLVIDVDGDQFHVRPHRLLADGTVSEFPLEEIRQ